MRWKTMILISVLALVAAACGGGEGADQDNGAATTVADGGNGTANPPTEETQPDSPSPGQSGSGEFTVNGDTFQIEEVRRCEPFDFNNENHPDNLDVAARSGGVFINVTIAGSTGFAPADNGVEEYSQQTHHLQLSLPTDSGMTQYETTASHDIDDVWYVGFLPIPGATQEGEMLDGPPFTVSGNTISGSMTVAKDFPDTNGSADVSFKFDFPDDIGEC